MRSAYCDWWYQLAIGRTICLFVISAFPKRFPRIFQNRGDVGDVDATAFFLQSNLRSSQDVFVGMTGAHLLHNNHVGGGSDAKCL